MKSLGMTACAHERPYVSCEGHWGSMAELAGKMNRDQKYRKLGSLGEEDTNAAIEVWAYIYAKIDAMVIEHHGSLMRLALSERERQRHRRYC